MTNEMKLLHALCEALGFEVETTLDYKEVEIGYDEAMRINSTYYNSNRILVHDCGKFRIDSDGMYTSMLIDPIVDYKLEKRDERTS